MTVRSSRPDISHSPSTGSSGGSVAATPAAPGDAAGGRSLVPPAATTSNAGVSEQPGGGLRPVGAREVAASGPLAARAESALSSRVSPSAGPVGLLPSAASSVAGPAVAEPRLPTIDECYIESSGECWYATWERFSGHGFSRTGAYQSLCADVRRGAA